MSETLEDVQPFFGEPNVEWEDRGSIPLHRLLFYVHALDPSKLRIYVTDFRSNHWEVVRSIQQLEDMRDIIGIGGSWSEFMGYVIASLKSEDVKLSLQGRSAAGAASAKLVCQKAKGMPRIAFPMVKVIDSAENEATANLYLELFNSLKSTQKFLVEEQERSDKLKKEMLAEREKNEDLRNKLDLYSKRQKIAEMNATDEVGNSASQITMGLQNSPDKKIALGSTKVTNRVVPAYRRAKVRGALLQDTEDDKES